MALPTKEKVWSFSANNRSTFVSVLATTKDLLFGLKQSLLLMTGMTTKGSSNGAAAAMDGVDRWGTAGAIGARVANITTAGASWYTLTSSVLGVEITLSFIGGADNAARIAYSVGGYTLAGTPTQHPTFTDEQVPHGTSTSGIDLSDATASLDRLWSVGYANDGTCWFMTIARNNVLAGGGFICMQKASTLAVVSPASFTPAVWGYGAGSAGNLALTITNLCNFSAAAGTQCPVARANPGAGSISIDHAAFSCEAFQNAATSSLNTKYNFAPELQGGVGFILQGLGLHSFKTGVRGKLCNVIDMWLGFNAATVGDTYPNDATRQFLTLGGTSGLTLPWNGSVWVGA